jgi:glycosyltransferase involved in cell wall biosynthesis
MTPARVCMTVETFFPVIGGGETQALALAEDLVATGHEVHVVTRRSSHDSPREELLGRVRVHRLGPAGPGQLKKWGMVATSFLFYLRYRRSFDIILVSGFRVLGIPAVIGGWLLGKPSILKADNNGEFSGDYFRQGITKLGLRWAAPLIGLVVRLRNALFRRSTAFVALSGDIRDELTAGGVPPERIMDIPNGYDPARFFPPADAGEKQRLRERLGLPAEGTLVVFTGRLLRAKGLPSLLQAWRDIASSHPLANLIIIGSGAGLMGSCEEELRAYVQHHGLAARVVFTGGVRNVEDYLRAAELFAFPTEDEAFGIALIEAMAAGLACVASAVGGIKDIIRDGDNGLLVPAQDTPALRSALSRLLDDPALARRLGVQAAGESAERYARRSVARSYARLFSELNQGRS